MEDNIAIKVENISKKYVIGERQVYLTLRDQLSSLPKKLFSKHKPKEFWALKNISFEVKKGEVLGIVGRNGAGKSTLLKILSRITEPTSGKIIFQGKISSMLEVGTGFNPELTGRENIYLNGSILGMKKNEINNKFDEIVKFANIGEFLDTPVKRYSSGMFVRLAFAVAAHLDSEILLIDEVLAVGDTEFQSKCIEKISQLTHSGRTIIIVTHNLGTVKNHCDKAIYLKRGRKLAIGNVSSVIGKYLDIDKSTKQLNFPINKKLNAQIIKLEIDGTNEINYDEKICFMIDTILNKNNFPIYLAISVYDQYENNIVFWRDFELKKNYTPVENIGHYKFLATIPGNLFSPGNYRIEVGLGDFDKKQAISSPERGLKFTVRDDSSLRKKFGFPWRGVTSVPINIEVSKQ